MAHPIENIMKTTMEQIREMVDVNTIVGNPIAAGGDTMILPVSKVCLGFVSGGGEYRMKGALAKSVDQMREEEERLPFAGTAVAGMALTPVAFLAVSGSQAHLLPAKYDCMWDHVIERLPCAVEGVLNIVKEWSDSKSKQNQGTQAQESTQPGQ